MQISIIGGGIAGLSIAKALEKNNISCAIYEAAPELRPVGAGISLAFNAMRACASLEVYDAVVSRGRPIDKGLITSHKGKIISQFHYNNHLQLFGDVALAIHRFKLQEALIHSLKSTPIYLNKRATNFNQTAEDVTISFEDNEIVNSAYAIAADGIHSIFRRTLIPGSNPIYSGYTCWRGIGELPESYPWTECVNESWGPGHRLGIVPLPDNTVYWFAVKNAPERNPEMYKAKKEDILQYFRFWEPFMLEVVKQTPQENIILSDIIDIDPISQFAFGNILLCGDAAHATTPNMGQGGCQALVDAAILDKCLANASSIHEAFVLFQKKRIEKTKRVILNSRKFGKMAQSENKLFISLRNFLISLVPEKTSAKQLLWLKEEDLC